MESPPIWYKKKIFQIMTLINLCNTICNQVNEEKFMFQIGSIIPIVLTNGFHSTDLFFVFFISLFPAVM